jgi:hypothetical protein
MTYEMEQSVSKRRHVKFRSRGITQKNKCKIHSTAKVWNHEVTSFPGRGHSFERPAAVCVCVRARMCVRALCENYFFRGKEVRTTSNIFNKPQTVGSCISYVGINWKRKENCISFDTA